MNRLLSLSFPMLLFYALLAGSAYSLQTVNPSRRYPLILVPGYQGSQLQVKLDAQPPSNWRCGPLGPFPRLGVADDVVWLQVSNFRSRYVDCWEQKMKLHYDNETRRSSSAPGVRVYPKGPTGSVEPVEFTSPQHSRHSNYFGYFVRAMVRLGYRRDVDIRGAAYDWRKAPYENEEFATGMRSLIEGTANANNAKPVVIICHSMGCLFTYHFLKNQPKKWKDEYIKALLITATPWDGNFKYFYSYIGTDDEPNTRLWPRIRSVERTLSALAFLLPHSRAFLEHVLIESPTKNYTLEDYQEIFAKLNNSDAYEMWNNGKDLLGRFEHPEVDVYCLGGVGVPTMSKIVYEGQFPESYHRFEHADGDGVLLTKSMRGCRRWENGSKEHTFNYTEFPGISHMGILQDRLPLQRIADIVQSL